jgi:CBS domain-containing protein
VLVSGIAQELTRPSDLADADRLQLQPWAPGLKGHLVRIRADAVTGRRIPQLAASDHEVPSAVLTGPDTPVGALALRRVVPLAASATVSEAIAALHAAGSPVGELGHDDLAGSSQLVSLAGLVRLLGAGTGTDESARRAAGQHLVVLTPHLSVLGAVQAMVDRNVGCAVVRPTGGEQAGVLTLADVLPALLWFFDPAVAALIPRG